MNDSFSFPTFWRSPIASSSTSTAHIIMPGSTDQESLASHGDELQKSLTGGLTEHRTHTYVNRPAGEMDMMVGFFLMNGVCIFFFLLFGLCVIFSCLRKKPPFLRRKQFNDIEEAPLNQEEQGVIKPKFKSIVSQVIKTNKVTTTVATDNETDSMELNTNGIQQVKVHAVPQMSRSPSPQPRKISLAGSRKPSVDGSRRCSTSISAENSAMIRHNLLGPLSFDDLYYM